MTLLDDWTRGEHTADGITHPTYRRGTGPGVIVIHEIPGLTPEVIGFADEVVAAGFTVVLPHLFGEPEAPMNPLTVARSMTQVCVSREFTKLATGETTPVAGWLRSLARELHAELGGPGVGALGMCFTGGFALAMMVDPAVAAPVLAQPSVPFAVTPGRSRDLNLSPADLAAVKERAAAGCEVLGLRYRKDPTVGKRFETLTREIGDKFLRVELEGRGHATVTAHRQQEAVDRVLRSSPTSSTSTAPREGRPFEAASLWSQGLGDLGRGGPAGVGVTAPSPQVGDLLVARGRCGLPQWRRDVVNVWVAGRRVLMSAHEVVGEAACPAPRVRPCERGVFQCRVFQCCSVRGVGAGFVSEQVGSADLCGGRPGRHQGPHALRIVDTAPGGQRHVDGCPHRCDQVEQFRLVRNRVRVPGPSVTTGAGTLDNQ